MEFKTINPQVIEQFRSGREIEGVPGVTRENHILLTTLGRTSGRRQTIPLRVFHAHGDRLVVVAGNGGRAPNPGWYLNLVAEPRVTIEDGEETYDAVATEITGAERDELWQLFKEQNPGLTEYLAGAAGRVIPVVALTRIPGEATP
ncbi:nitroreductase family deazaflavin-dependent oxidoreductase [Amycolatopsis sp. NBC_00345]|uniref:nitroreductase/quinone reductase family protein n=1 Tax=Amycolatopsis sp. NBC_00345 TaxID=2975955 RepID=UPI002E265EAF